MDAADAKVVTPDGKSSTSHDPSTGSLMAEIDVIRGAVARLLTETAIDSWLALECDLAELLGIEPGTEPFTWQWSKHLADGLWLDPGMDTDVER